MSLCFSDKNRIAQNLIFQNEYDQIARDCNKKSIFLVPLKGISFFNRIYDFSERQLTDIDLYTTDKDFPALQKLVLSYGYIQTQEEKWRENHHKHCFSKTVMGLEVLLEIHTQLLINKKKDQWNFMETPSGFLLVPQDELLYLCYHYARQHTLLNEKWLQDIYRLCLKKSLWTPELWSNAKQKDISSALIFTAHALNTKHKMRIDIPRGIKSFFASKLIHLDFIEHSEKYPLRYLTIKHLVKNSLAEALLYNGSWIYSFIKQRLKKKCKS